MSTLQYTVYPRLRNSAQWKQGVQFDSSIETSSGEETQRSHDSWLPPKRYSLVVFEETIVRYVEFVGIVSQSIKPKEGK